MSSTDLITARVCQRINSKGAIIDHWFIVGATISLVGEFLYDPISPGDHDCLPDAGTDAARGHHPSRGEESV